MPDGNPAWLQINGSPEGKLLWSVGSARPVQNLEINGKTVINNEAIEGCTGGGLSADDTAPGPIFLQGDHTNVRYRNIRLEPVMK